MSKFGSKCSQCKSNFRLQVIQEHQLYKIADNFRKEAKEFNLRNNCSKLIINIKTLINNGYFLKVINIKKEKLFPKIFRFHQNRNLVEKSVLGKRKFIKNFKNIFFNCIMLTFLRLVASKSSQHCEWSVLTSVEITKIKQK